VLPSQFTASVLCFRGEIYQSEKFKQFLEMRKEVEEVFVGDLLSGE
jgi:hypothetical protein